MARRHFLVQRRPDANQKAICTALKAVGARIFDLSGASKGIPDLCVLTPSKQIVFLEIKTAKGKLRETQIEIAKDWPVKVVRNEAEALAAIGIKGCTAR